MPPRGTRPWSDCGGTSRRTNDDRPDDVRPHDPPNDGAPRADRACLAGTDRGRRAIPVVPGEHRPRAQGRAEGWFDFGELGRHAVRVESSEAPTRVVWRWAREADTPVAEGQSTTVEWTLTAVAPDRTRLDLYEWGFVDPAHRRQQRRLGRGAGRAADARRGLTPPVVHRAPTGQTPARMPPGYACDRIAPTDRTRRAYRLGSVFMRRTHGSRPSGHGRHWTTF